MLQMFYQSVVASTIFFTVVSWGAGIKAKDANRLNKLIKKAGSVVGSELVTLEEVVEDRMLSKLLAIMDPASHPPHRTLDKLKSSFNNRLIQAHCLKECHRKSFLPGAIRLYNCAHYKTQNTQNCCSSCYFCGPNFPFGINKVIDRLVCLCIFASMKDISSIYELSPSPQ